MEVMLRCKVDKIPLVSKDLTAAFAPTELSENRNSRLLARQVTDGLFHVDSNGFAPRDLNPAICEPLIKKTYDAHGPPTGHLCLPTQGKYKGNPEENKIPTWSKRPPPLIMTLA